MAPREDIALSDARQPSISSANDSPGTQEEAVSSDETESREWDSSRKRAMVMVGSGLLQLPIWGITSFISALSTGFINRSQDLQ